MKVRIYDRNGHLKTMERRYAAVLVKLGRARYAPNEQDTAGIDYETKVIENAPIRKRGRPAGKNRS